MELTEIGVLRTQLEQYSDNKFDALTTDMDYKGSVASASNLPASGTLGDVYTTVDTGARYVWDGTQWTRIDGGTMIEDIKTIVDHISGQSYNLVSGTLSGLTIDSSGGMVNWGGTTDMVIAPVVSGKTYTIKTDDSSSFVGAFYYAEPTASTSASYNNSRTVGGSKTFVAPITGWVAFRVSRNYQYAQIVDGDKDLPYTYPITAVDVIARNEIDDLLIPVDEYTKQSGTVTDGKYLASDGGEITASGWEYENFDCLEGEVYTISSYTGSYAQPWVILNSSNTVVAYAGIPSPSNYALRSFRITIPANGTKLAVNNKSDSGEIIVSKVIQNGKKFPSNILEGKVLCCAGDSITYGADMDSEGIVQNAMTTIYQSDASGNFSKVTSNYLATWGFQIANRNKMIFYNAGVSGSTMQGISEKNGFSLENGRYTKLPDIIDYLLLWFGWNDNAYGTLGTIDDNTNETYYGAYNVVVPYLQRKYPYTKIGLIVPFGASADHRQAIRDLGNKWGLAVWDNYKGGTPLYYGKEQNVGVSASVVTENQAKYQANGAHPNYQGHKQLGDMIEAWMRTI